MNQRAAPPNISHFFLHAELSNKMLIQMASLGDMHVYINKKIVMYIYIIGISTYLHKTKEKHRNTNKFNSINNDLDMLYTRFHYHMICTYVNI